jgi:uncharacterized protein YukE
MVNPAGGAEIIPFPVRRAAAPTPDRLSTALTALSQALTEQQEAVRQWRQAMDDLNQCMQRLSGGVSAVQGTGGHGPAQPEA